MFTNNAIVKLFCCKRMSSLQLPLVGTVVVTSIGQWLPANRGYKLLDLPECSSTLWMLPHHGAMQLGNASCNLAWMATVRKDAEPDAISVCTIQEKVEVQRLYDDDLQLTVPVRMLKACAKPLDALKKEDDYIQMVRLPFSEELAVWPVKRQPTSEEQESADPMRSSDSHMA